MASTSGTDIASLGLGVDTKPVMEGIDALDKLDATYKKTRVTLNDLDAGLAKLTTTADSNTNSTKRQLAALREAAKAEAELAAAQRDRAAATIAVSEAGDRLLAKLEDMVAIYGLTKNQLLEFRAAEYGVAEAAGPLIAQLNAMAEATARYGVVITEVSQIEGARVAWEEKNIAILQAFKTRTMAENRAAAIAEIDQMEALRIAAHEKELADIAIFEAFKRRTMAENRAEASAIAEKEAMSEIAWGRMSLKARISQLEELQAFQANSAIRSETIQKMFSGAAIRDLPNLTALQKEYAESVHSTTGAHSGGHQAAETFRGALDQISFGSSRARSELIVLAHEAVQGRFSRMPASFMVLAEYTNAASLAFTGMGVAALGLLLTLGFVGYEIIKGAFELDKFNKSLALTSNYSGQTRDSLMGMNKELVTSKTTIGAASEMMEGLVATGKFGAESLHAVGRAALDFQYLTGQSTEQVVGYFQSMVKVHGKVFNDMSNHTADWAAKANESYHFLSAAQYEHIRQLSLQGEQQKAIIEITEAMSKSFATHKVEVGYIAAVYLGWKIILSDVAHYLQEIGKGETTGARLTVEAEKLKSLIALRDKMKAGTADLGGIGVKADAGELDLMQKKIDAQLKAVMEAQQKYADQAGEAQRKADLGRLNQLGVVSQRELDYVKAANKTQMQLQADKIMQVADAAANINRSNMATWEDQYKGSKANMQRDMELAIESGELKVVKEEELNKIIAGIKAKHHGSMQDGRKQDLMSQLEDDKQSYDAAKSATENNEKLIDEAHKKGGLEDKAYYAILRENRNDQLLALTQSYEAQVKTIENYQAKGANDVAQTKKRLVEITNAYELAKQKIEEAGKLTDLQQEENAAKKYEDTIKAIQNAGFAELDSLDKAIDKQKKHNAEIGQTAREKELVIAAIEREEIASLQLDSIYLKGIIDQGNWDQQTLDAFTIRATMLDREIEKRKELADLAEAGSNLQAQKEIQKEIDKNWRDVNKKIGDDLLSAIVDGGGKGYKKLIRDMELAFAKMILRPILEPIANGIANALYPNSSGAGGIGALAGAVGGNSSSAGGIMGSFGNLSTLYSAGQTLYSGFAGGLSASLGGMISTLGSTFGSAAMSSFGAGMALTSAEAAAMAATANAAAAGTAAAGSTAAAGGALTAGASAASVVPIIGWIIAGMMANNSYFKQGWKMDGQKGDMTGELFASGLKGNVLGPLLGTATVLIGATDTLARKIGFNDQMASLISGSALWTRAFGRKAPEIESAGVRGLLTDDGVKNGQSYANIVEKGGWFRSDKRSTQTSEIGADFQNSLMTGFVGLKSAAEGFGKVLGVDTSVIKDYTKAFDVKIDTKDAKKNEEALVAFFTTIGDELSNKLIPNIGQFAKLNETASATLERLATDFKATDEIAMLLGKTGEKAFGGAGLASVKAREQFIDLNGGLSTLTTQVGNYAKNFLTDSEKLAPVQDALLKSMTELGFASVVTKDQFKGVVNSLDLTTKEGAQTFASLMQIQEAFFQITNVADVLKEATNNIRIELLEAQGRKYEALSLAREKELVGLSAVEKALKLEVFAAQDKATTDELTLRLMTAQGREQEVLNFQRQQELKGLSASDKAIAQQIHNEENLTKTRSLTISLLRALHRDEQALNMERERELAALSESDRAIQKKIYMLEDAFAFAESALNNLKDSVQAQKEIIDKQFENNKTAINDKADAERLALQARRTTAETTLQATTNILTQLNSALQNNVSAQKLTLAMRNEAELSLMSKLRIINGGGSVESAMKNGQSLDRSLEVVGQDSKQFFSTSIEYERDQARVRNLLQSLSDKTEDVVSKNQDVVDALDKLMEKNEKDRIKALKDLDLKHEKSIKKLDDLIKAEEDQLNALKGIPIALTSLGLAISSMTAAIAGIKAATAGVGVVTPTAPGSKGSNEDVVKSLYKDLLGRAPEQEGLDFWTNGLNSGVSLSDIIQGFKNSDEYKKLHPFADGINYVPRDMPAYLHEGERVLPKADNAQLMSRLSSEAVDTRGLERRVDRLILVVEKMSDNNSIENLAIVGNTGTMSRLHKRWDVSGAPVRATDPTLPIAVSIS